MMAAVWFMAGFIAFPLCFWLIIEWPFLFDGASREMVDKAMERRRQWEIDGDRALMRQYRMEQFQRGRHNGKIT
jgi:hypothetical protein